MTVDERLLTLEQGTRTIATARAGDPLLGPLRHLPGTWVSKDQGWNMIALPFATSESGGLPYRLLLNQFGETLNFTLVDTKVPNRGVDASTAKETDQFVVTLDYEQLVHQVEVTDRPASPDRGERGLPIHHEPGLFLNMVNRVDGLDVARLATIPHGDAALVLGTSTEVDGLPGIPAVDGLPVGVDRDLDSPYLEPYRHFHDHPFAGGITGVPGFPGFDPTAPHALLEFANQGVDVTSTTVLDLDTTNGTGGIHNLPFVVKQANATSMRSTFWIQEVAGDPPGWRLQYLQVVSLEFFPRTDGLPGRIVWPHVSINTLDRQAPED